MRRFRTYPQIGGKKGGIPDGWVEVEYIQGDGNSYIVTGIPCADIESIDISFVSYEPSVAGNPCIFGGSAFSQYKHLLVQQSSGGYRLYSNGVILNSTRKNDDDCRLTIEMIKGSTASKANAEMMLNDTKVYSDEIYFSYNGTGNLALLAMNDGSRRSHSKLKSVKINDSHLVPVRNATTNEGAMCDVLTGTIYRNAGTGAFVVGPDKREWTNPYVTDGLVAMWDGEWNAGGGMHDPNATVWKDLVGSRNWILSGGLSFGDDYITGDGSADAYGVMGESDSSVFGSGSNNVLVECCFESSSTNSGARGLFAGPTTGNVTALAYISRMILGNSQSINWASAGAAFRGTFQVGLNRAINGGPFAEGYPTIGGQSGYAPVQPYAMIFKYHNAVAGSPDIRMHGLRIYNRALAADEIAANYAIDKARFGLP